MNSINKNKFFNNLLKNIDVTQSPYKYPKKLPGESREEHTMRNRKITKKQSQMLTKYKQSPTETFSDFVIRARKSELLIDNKMQTLQDAHKAYKTENTKERPFTKLQNQLYQQAQANLIEANVDLETTTKIIRNKYKK